MSRVILMALLVGALVRPVPRVAAGDIPERLIAIGDIHGEFDGLVSILRETGLIDRENQWIGGGATLVQTGDFLDRGPDVKAVVDLLIALQEQATRQGGRVMILMGNHEAMNLIGDFQDATPEMLASFAGPQAEKLRERGWKEWVRWMNRLARSRGGQAPALGKERKEQWMAEHPPGYFEYIQALEPNGDYGQWLRQLPVMVQLGDTMFMHAGISSEYAELSVEEINALHREEMATWDENRRALVKAGLVPWFFNVYEINQALIYQIANPPLEENRIPIEMRRLTQASEDLNRMQEILLQDSPLWYRGFTTLSDDQLREHLDRLEQSYGTHRFVVAHSPMDSGNIRGRLDGRVFLIDTGMLQSYYHGRASALEVADGRISAVYLDERQVLVDPVENPIPASAAASDSASLHRREVVPAVHRSPGPGRVMAAAYPPEGEAGSVLPERIWRDPDGNPLPFQAPQEMEDFLVTAVVVSQEEIPVAVTKPRRILLDKDGVRAHAKFSYVDRERKGKSSSTARSRCTFWTATGPTWRSAG
jgi:hypothetical protein